MIEILPVGPGNPSASDLTAPLRVRSFTEALLTVRAGAIHSRRLRPGSVSAHPMAICPRCATESPGGFRYCGACGAPLPSAGESGEIRKVVTAMFCDVADSTALGESLDPEALRHILNEYFEEISTTVRRHGGTVQKYAGDAVMAVFGAPRSNEDDALRAVRAAAEIRDRLPEVGDRVGVSLRFRIGLNTGLVLADEGKFVAIGDAINVAARLEQAARPGEILLGFETLRMVRDAVEVEPLEPLTLKGKSEPVRVFRLLSADPIAPGRSRRLDAALVGRAHELEVLREAWDRTIASSECHLFTLLGPAGVGKSRLVAELLGAVGTETTVLAGRCLHYGEGITFWPIIEALAAAGERARSVSELLDGGGAATPEELFLKVRRLLESLARERPVILLVDDLQWAEPMLLDLLDNLVELSRGAPLMLVCAARLELLEHRTGWGGGKLHATTLLLEPLGAAECEQLLDELDDALEPDTRERVIRASEGNPLFIEEMVELARERGTVVVPQTIQALLTARLDGLIGHQRELLERGAVEGHVFHRSAMSVLANDRTAAEIELHLAGLVRNDLIRPHPPARAHDEAFRFRHLLIRDAAYERLPKATRADLHARFASWLESTAADLPELDEIAGWHLEQSVDYQRELGRSPDPALVRRAATHLYEAGHRAAERSDVAAARKLLERALALAPEADELTAAIRGSLAEQLIEAGELARADQLISAAEQASEASGPTSLHRLELLVRARPGQARQLIEHNLPQMLEQLNASGEHRDLARAHMLGFWVRWNASQATPAAEQSRLAAQHARAAGDIGLWSRALGWYVATLIYGPPSAAKISTELEAIDAQQPGPYLAACADIGRGEVQRLESRFSEAQRLTQRALDGFRSLGMRTMEATCEQSLARVEMSGGELEKALASLRRSDRICAELGERLLRSTTQAMLARAHQLMDELDAAQAAADLAEELSDPKDVANFAITHEVRARLALAGGDLGAAERWARSGLGHAMSTDFVGLQAETKLSLARILTACGQPEEAVAEGRAALGLFAAKGDRLGCAAARELLASEAG